MFLDLISNVKPNFFAENVVMMANERLGNKKKMGKIELILGPMFSGKSTELMRRMKRYQVG